MDQVEADLVLLSTEAVHSKAVDANLLAEFVDCPGWLSWLASFGISHPLIGMVGFPPIVSILLLR